MKKGLTELVFILDRSGSMSGLENDTIGGFNGMIKKQRDEEGEANVTTVLFDHNIKTIHDGVNIKELSDMTSKDYYVGGSTALLDAIGSTIKSVNKKQKNRLKRLYSLLQLMVWRMQVVIITEIRSRK